MAIRLYCGKMGGGMAMLPFDAPVRTGSSGRIVDLGRADWGCFLDAHGQIDAPSEMLGGPTVALLYDAPRDGQAPGFVTQCNLSRGPR